MGKSTKTLTEKRRAREKRTAEIFTPPWLVNKMFDTLPLDIWEEDQTVLDPACGDGNFLVEALTRKLKLGHNPLKALQTIFGVDIMRDNIRECRIRLLKIIGLFEPITREHIKAVFKNIVFLNRVKYPKGSLQYNFSFSETPKREDIDEWMEKINKNGIEDMGLTVEEDNFEEKGDNIFFMFDNDENEDNDG